MLPEDLQKLLKENKAVVMEELTTGATKKIYRGYLKEGRRRREVVIKQILPELLFNKKVKKIFRQEPAALLKISHPNVEKAYKIIETESHLLMICEYIKGCSLTEFTDKLRAEGKNLNEEEVVRIGIQIASGLKAIHQLGFVHRDLSLSNVMINEEGEQQVKIIDLGLAKRYGQPGLSLFFYIEGTPPFAAPEQIIDPIFVDERADIFSLGTILYYLLSWNFPYGNEEKYYEKVRAGKPLPLKKFRKDISPELETLILECLHFQPQMRPTAEEVEERLKTILNKRKELPSDINSEIFPDKGKIKVDPAKGKKARAILAASLLLCLVGLLLTVMSKKAGSKNSAETPGFVATKEVSPSDISIERIEVFTGTAKITYDSSLQEIKREVFFHPKVVKVFVKKKPYQRSLK